MIKTKVHFVGDDTEIIECKEVVHCRNGLEKFNLPGDRAIAYPVYRIKFIEYEEVPDEI